MFRLSLVVVDHEHMLRSIIEGLLAVHEKVEEQQAELDKRVRQAAKTDETTRRLRSNTVPIGAIPTGLQVCDASSSHPPLWAGPRLRYLDERLVGTRRG